MGRFVRIAGVCGVIRREYLGHQIVEIKFQLKSLPQQYIDAAKKIDGPYYQEDCFSFIYRYDIDDKEYMVVSKQGREVCYLDNNGDEHYMDYKIPKSILCVARKQFSKETVNVA